MGCLGRLVAVLGVLLLLFLLVSWGNHQLRLLTETRLAVPMGEMVSVNGYQLHVYVQSSGRPTCVFLAGSGTSSPVLDFKPLWSRLTGRSRIAVVERAGYGFSDDPAGISRDVERLVEDSRQALAAAGESPPYVLVVHSMAALEALYWAHQYPREVRGIVGIDPAVPETYEYISIPPYPILRTLSLFASAGVTRLLPLGERSPILQMGHLGAEDADLYRELIYRRTLTGNMLAELRVVKDSARRVGALGVPRNTPMYFFISDGDEVGVTQWRELLRNYTGQLRQGDYRLLEGGHYLHHYDPESMADQIRRFLNRL